MGEGHLFPSGYHPGVSITLNNCYSSQLVDCISLQIFQYGLARASKLGNNDYVFSPGLPEILQHLVEV
jgi:hypothetical protein